MFTSTRRRTPQSDPPHAEDKEDEGGWVGDVCIVLFSTELDEERRVPGGAAGVSPTSQPLLGGPRQGPYVCNA